MQILRFPDLPTLASAAADKFVEIAEKAIEERGQFSVALSGGSTPKALYAKLVNAEIDWNKVLFFFGDERNVPRDHRDSNFRMADETLFRPLNISTERTFRWRTELNEPSEVADDFVKQIVYGFAKAHADAAEKAVPRPAGPGTTFEIYNSMLDLILLGMGTDGHTSSLFPHTAALNETQRSAVANWVPQLDTWRYTLTFPVINNARNVMFLVAGADKAETLKDILEGERQPDKLPAQLVQPADGHLFWFVDEAAARLLDKH